MTIKEELVVHVAKLAKLEFEDEEIHGFTEEFNNILDMMERLTGLDTEGIPGTYHGLIQENVWREDVSEKGTDRDELMKNVKNHKDGFIEVPAMFDDGESGA